VQPDMGARMTVEIAEMAAKDYDEVLRLWHHRQMAGRRATSENAHSKAACGKAQSPGR